MLNSINHIGIAVRDLDVSIETFRKIFQFEDIHKEMVDEQKVNVASFKIGDVLIELTAPTDETSPVAKFIEKRGEGIHHIAFGTDDIYSELERLSDTDINLIDPTPRKGAHDMLISFLHPKSSNSVLIEICQKNKL